jgi:CheY-like chemotaxis protein
MAHKIMVFNMNRVFNVLLLEDEPADANLVRLSLKESAICYKLHHVFDGIEGLAFLHNQDDTSPRPDLILLDMNMPRMNGQEFLSVIKANSQFASIPVVVLSTSEVERDVISAYKLGAAGYISKPVDIEQFINALQQIINYWFAIVRLP